MNPEIELLLRRKLTEEEFLIVRAEIETIVNQHRVGQDSTHFIKMIKHFINKYERKTDEKE